MEDETFFKRLKGDIKEIRKAFSSDYKSDDDAFAHWIVREQFDKEEEDARIACLAGGKGDLGVDALWADDKEKVVYICQAKHYLKEKVGRTTLDILIATPNHLSDKNYVEQTGNDEVIEKSRLYRKSIRKGYQTRLVLGTSSFLTPDASSFVGSWNMQHPEDLSIKIFDLLSLKTKYEENLSKLQEEKPDVELHIVPTQFFVKNIDGGKRSLVATIKGKELAMIGEKHKFALFLDNIRYDLGLNKVNQGMCQTLSDPVENKFFWHFNNGLSVVCDSFDFDKNTGEIKINKMQIVNGCQTTKTLARYLSENEKEISNDVEILVRITETRERELSDKIARYNNSQTEVKDSDLLSNENVQKRLEKEIEKYGWIYLRQRGQEKKYKEKNLQKKFSALKKDKKVIEFVKTTQRCIAFDLQEPGMARGRPRDIFGTSERNKYHQIFNESTTAEMLILPNFLFERIRLGRLKAQDEIEQMKLNLRQMENEGKEDKALKKLENDIQVKSFIRHADFHILALFYRLLRIKYGEVTDEQRRKVLQDPNFDTNFERIYRPIKLYLEMLVAEEYKMDPDFSKENFFKSPESYDDVEEFFDGKDAEDIARERSRLIDQVAW